MKKLILATAILATSATAFANGGGTINFYGKVTNVSCTVSVNGQGSDADVYLSPISSNEFLTNNTIYKQKPFTIDVSDCIASNGDLDDPSDMIIGVKFTGGNLATFDSSYLANSSSSFDGAQGVYLILTTNTGKQIDIGMSDQATSESENLNGIKRFNYNVGYISKDIASVTAGDVQSYATYQITYD